LIKKRVYSIFAGIGLYAFLSMVIDLDIMPFVGVPPNIQVFLSSVLVGPTVVLEDATRVESGGVSATIGLAMFLVFLTILRSQKIGVRTSIYQTVFLIAPFIVFVFSLDFITLDPGDFHNVLIYYFYQVHLYWITNELALIVSGVWLGIGVILQSRHWIK
jgi:hypothetical protein